MKVHPNLGADPWESFTKKIEGSLSKIDKLKSSKAIFYFVNEEGNIKYLVSRKRLMSENENENEEEKKNNKWEFLGGRIDKGETALSALKRELIEEDPSRILLNHLETNLKEKNPLFIKVPKLEDKTSHCLFLIEFEESLWLKLKEDYRSRDISNLETYGFELTGQEALVDLRKNKGPWTPKTRKLLEALQKGNI